MGRDPDSGQLVGRLRQTPLFETVDESILKNLAQSARWREFGAGEIVFLEGEKRSGLFYLQSGWLKVVKLSPGGREQILRFLEPGETFNEIGVFADQPNPATAIALEPAGIWQIRRDHMMQLLNDRPEFAQQIISKMAARMLHLVSLVTDLSLRSVTGRLARLLLDDAVDGILHRPRWYTQTELAARLGTVPDVIQRSLRYLEKEELIVVEKKQIRILKRDDLARLTS